MKGDPPHPERWGGLRGSGASLTPQTNNTALWENDGRGVATVTLNRPKVNNAYNGDLIGSLHEALDALGKASG